MPATLFRPIPLHSEAQTTALAQAIAPHLGARDVLALWGEIGAGKSHFARALIRARLNAVGRDEDVPSPTFTLVQTYDAGDLQIWHTDLYRLTNPDEVLELGLDEAFETALCLVEWPDRLGTDLPARALHLCLEPGADDNARLLSIRSDATDWTARLAPILTEMAADHA